MFKLHLFTLILSFFSFKSIAQSNRIDITELEKIQARNLDSAKLVALDILDKESNKNGEYYHSIRINLATTLWKLRDVDSAQIMIHEVPFSQLPTQQLKVRQLICEGDLHDIQGESDLAVSTYLNALGLAKKHGFKKEMGIIHNNLGIVYMIVENYPKSRMNLLKSLKIRTELGDSASMARTYSNIGGFYRRRQKIDSARIVYRKGLEIRKNLGDIKGVNAIYMNIAILDQVEGKREDAIKTYEQVIKLAGEINDNETYVLAHTNMGSAYYYSGDYQKAEQVLLKALDLSEQFNSKTSLLTIYQALSMIYEKKNDASSVMKYRKLYHTRHTEIYNLKKEQEMNRLQIKFESQEKDNEISELKNQQIEDQLIAKEKELKTGKTLFWVYLSIIVLTLSLIFILIVYLRKRTYSERQKQLLEEREILLKEVHHRVKNNLQIVSSLLSLQGELTNNLNPQEVLVQSQNRIQSIAIIHEKLYQTSSLANVKLNTYVDQLVDYLSDSYGLDELGITIECDIDPIKLDLDQIVPCGLIINELVTNSIKHGQVKQGIIRISGQLINNQMVIDIEDNGPGLPEDFDLSKSQSLGLKLSKGLARQLKGTLELLSGSSGAHFKLTINPTV